MKYKIIGSHPNYIKIANTLTALEYQSICKSIENKSCTNCTNAICTVS